MEFHVSIHLPSKCPQLISAYGFFKTFLLPPRRLWVDFSSKDHACHVSAKEMPTGKTYFNKNAILEELEKGSKRKYLLKGS